MSLGQALIESAIFAVLATVVAVVLAQPDFYKTDGTYLVQQLVDGNENHPYNIGYLPVASAFYEPAHKALGASEFDAASWLSALGYGLAVALAHLGFRRALPASASGRDRSVQSFAATLAFACTPGVLFFGTVIEMHAVFLPVAMLAFWLGVELRWVRSNWAAAVLGALAGAVGHAGFLMHGTGLVLPGLLLPTIVLGLLWGERAWRGRTLAFSAALSVVHLGTWLVLPQRFPVTYRRSAETDGGLDLLMQGTGQSFDALDLPGMVWHEFLWPFLPFLLLAVWPRATGAGDAFRRSGLRLGLLIGALPYLLLCGLLLVREPEFGAYALPLAWPIALAASSFVRGRWGSLVFVIALLAAGLVFAERSERQSRVGASFADAWEQGVEQAIDARGMAPDRLWFLAIQNDEVAAILSRRGQDLIINLFVLTGIPAGSFEGLLPTFFSRVRTAHSERATVVFTDGTAAALGPEKTEILLEGLRTKFRVERFEHGAFGGYWIDRG